MYHGGVLEKSPPPSNSTLIILSNRSNSHWTSRDSAWRLRVADCRMQVAGYGLWATGCRPRMADCGSSSLSRRDQSRAPNASRSMPTGRAACAISTLCNCGAIPGALVLGAAETCSSVADRGCTQLAWVDLETRPHIEHDRAAELDATGV